MDNIKWSRYILRSLFSLAPPYRWIGGPRAFPARGGIADFAQVLPVEFDGGGADVFFEARQLRRAGGSARSRVFARAAKAGAIRAGVACFRAARNLPGNRAGLKVFPLQYAGKSGGKGEKSRAIRDDCPALSGVVRRARSCVRPGRRKRFSTEVFRIETES
jgi:hypothetical protein